MMRMKARSWTTILALVGFWSGLAVADPSGAASFPRLTARHAGSGTFEVRRGGTLDLTHARVVLDDRGSATIEVSGRNFSHSLVARMIDWNGRLHIRLALESLDGEPTTGSGWMELGRNGGFTRIEAGGKSPIGLAVSFNSKGPDLEPPSPPRAPPAPPAVERDLTEEYGIDRRGSDYSDFRADDLRSCQNICRRDSRCMAYYFNTRTQACYLKSNFPNSLNDREMVSGVKRAWGEGGGAAEGILTEERGFDRRGNDYTDFRATNLNDCQDACRREGRCRAYSYDTRSGACYLKDRINSQQPSSDTVTGFKDE